MTNAEAYSFRPVTLDDFPMIFQWREEPTVKKWFDELDREEVRDDFHDRRVRMQIVSHKDIPFAWIQDYDVHGWPDHHFNYLPAGARGIDLFIGLPEMQGRGHGGTFLAMVRDELFAQGVPAIGIDPHPENHAAKHLYEKLGFAGQKVVDTEWGPVILMSQVRPAGR